MDGWCNYLSQVVAMWLLKSRKRREMIFKWRETDEETNRRRGREEQQIMEENN